MLTFELVEANPTKIIYEHTYSSRSQKGINTTKKVNSMRESSLAHSKLLKVTKNAATAIRFGTRVKFSFRTVR